MDSQATRRDFIRAGSATAAGLLAGGAAQLAEGQHESHDQPMTNQQAEDPGDFPQTHAGPGGAFGRD